MVEGGEKMSCSSGCDSWTLVLTAVVLAAVLARDQTPDALGRMAAFFTVVGDTLAKLALQPEEHEDICRPPLSPAEKPGSPPCGP